MMRDRTDRQSQSSGLDTEDSPRICGAGPHAHEPQAERPAGCVHDHDRTGSARLLLIFILTAVYTLAEAAGGWLTGSLALLADAGHMAVDAVAVGLALLASRLAGRGATAEKTFGYFRFETLAAFINSATLLIISVSILYEAIERLLRPVPVESAGMMLVAAGGLAVNLAGIWLLHGHHDHDLNAHGAWLHLFGDMLGSLGAVTAGILMSLFGWYAADPLVSIAIAAIIVYSSWTLIKKAAHILLEGAPPDLSFSRVRDSILETDGVRAVHDLHLWAISSGRASLSCHVVHDDSAEPQSVLANLHEELRRRFGIRHLTLQMESDSGSQRLSAFCREGSRDCFGAFENPQT